MRSRHVIGAAACVFALAVPSWADLHYTMHTEARQVTPTEPANTMLAMAGDMMVQTMLPEGPADSIFWLSDKGTRIELTKANLMMPAGTVILHLADGTMALLNPKDKTYWKMSVPQMMPPMMGALSQLKPEMSFIHTGEFATIAGVRAEHITSRSTIDLPSPPAGAPVPMGMPTSITTSADLWMADQYANYSALARTTASMMGLDGLVPPGFMLKDVMRISIFPEYEIESVVTEIKEEPAPADAFEIPADYVEMLSPFPKVVPRPQQ